MSHPPEGEGKKDAGYNVFGPVMPEGFQVIGSPLTRTFRPKLTISPVVRHRAVPLDHFTLLQAAPPETDKQEIKDNQKFHDPSNSVFLK
jgi:hypothetical protein